MARSSGFRSIAVSLSGLILLVALPVSASEPVRLEAGELDSVTAAGAVAGAGGRRLEATGLGAFDLTDQQRETAIALLIPAVQKVREARRGARRQLPIRFVIRLGNSGRVPVNFFYSHAYSYYSGNSS
jgi:hypothetical protein